MLAVVVLEEEFWPERRTSSGLVGGRGEYEVRSFRKERDARSQIWCSEMVGSRSWRSRLAPAQWYRKGRGDGCGKSVRRRMCPKIRRGKEGLAERLAKLVKNGRQCICGKEHWRRRLIVLSKELRRSGSPGKWEMASGRSRKGALLTSKIAWLLGVILLLLCGSVRPFLLSGPFCFQAPLVFH